MRSVLVTLSVVAVLGSALSSPLAAQPLTAGPEISIALTGSFRDGGTIPALAAEPNGGFLTAWWFEGFKTRAVSPTDVPLAVARELNPTDRGLIAAVAPGRYVAVWSNQDGELLAQFLDAAGTPAGSPVLLAEGATLAQVAPLPTGGLAVAWKDPGPLTVPFRYLIRFFDAQGKPLGDPIDPGPLDGISALAVLPDGGFVIAWSKSLLPGGFGTQENLAQFFHADGSAAGPRITLAADADNPVSEPRIGVDGAGRVVIAWSEYPPYHVWARRFSSTGQPLGTPIPVSTEGQIPNVSGLAVRPDGRFLVEWGELPTSASDQSPPWGEVRARAYDAAGSPLGPSFLIHTSDDAAHTGGEAAATPDGWVVSWERTTTGQAGVYARRFTLSCGSTSALCLGGRFQAEVAWRIAPTGAEGSGIPIPLTSDTGAFWFFDPANYELAVKVLDGRAINGHYWVFYGSLTDVEFDLTITDTATGQQRTYHNPGGTMASRSDTEAF
jgi:hypothetical protein